MDATLFPSCVEDESSEMLELQCCVCIQVYSDRAAPRILGCGHCVCSNCVEELIPVPSRCPECREQFKATKASDLSINHTLLRLSRMHTFATFTKYGWPPLELSIKQPSVSAAESAGNCPLHGHMMFFICQTCNVTVCRDCLISDHPDQPYGKCVIASLKRRTEKLKKSNLETLKTYFEVADNIYHEFREILKGSKFVVEYMLRQIDEEEGETINDVMLEKARVFNKNCYEDLDKINNFKNYLNEINEKLENAQYMNDIKILMDDAVKVISEFEKLVVGKSEKELYNYMDTFWSS